MRHLPGFRNEINSEEINVQKEFKKIELLKKLDVYGVSTVDLDLTMTKYELLCSVAIDDDAEEPGMRVLLGSLIDPVG